MIIRHWFPVILGGLTILLGLGFLGIFLHRSNDSVPAETVDASSPAMTEAAYKEAVRTLLQSYAQNADATVAYDTLLLLNHIPASMKDVHIALVGAFGKLMAGAQDEGNLRLEALRAQYSWLIL